MHHVVHAVERPVHAFTVAHIADEIAQRRMIVAVHFHLVLLQLVAAEDDQLGRVVLAQHHLDKFLAKRPGATGNQNNFILPIHNFSLTLSAFYFLITISGY